jgi:hypothetical protein
MRFFPPYIFCVRTRTVELYPIPRVFLSSEHEHPTGMEIPNLKHAFPQTNFREASISSIHPSSPIISFLAYDVLRGFFHYHIHLPTFTVSLVGAYSLIQSVPQRNVPIAVRICLGTEGKRGMWIEREGRIVGRRKVVVFQTRANQEDRETKVVNNDPQDMSMDLDEDADTDTQPNMEFANDWLGTRTATIDGHVVYEGGSDDVGGMCCLVFLRPNFGNVDDSSSRGLHALYLF